MDTRSALACRLHLALRHYVRGAEGRRCRERLACGAVTVMMQWRCECSATTSGASSQGLLRHYFFTDLAGRQGGQSITSEPFTRTHTYTHTHTHTHTHNGNRRESGEGVRWLGQQLSTSARGLGTHGLFTPSDILQPSFLFPLLPTLPNH